MKLLVLLLTLFVVNSVQGKIVISGTVSDKNGIPVKKCDVFFNKTAWIDDNSIHVTCDEKGFYSAEIEPGLYNSVYVCDEELYGKSKLEFWGWNLNLEASQTLDAQFDTMEVFSLSAWASNGGSNSLFVSFRPMNLTKAKSPVHKMETHLGKELAVFDITPDLNFNTIKGFIDEKPLKLLNFSWVLEEVASCGKTPEGIKTDNGCFMPMVIAQFQKPALSAGQHTVRIDISDVNTGDFGQGITHITTNEKGLGF